MVVTSVGSFAGPVEMVAAARVARLHYLDKLSNVQIAQELGTSRFKVARLLSLARDSGIVRITVIGDGSVDLDLSEALHDRFGLRHAVVANTTPGSDEETRDQLGGVAADLLTEITTPQDVLGIGWARVVLAMAAKLRGFHAQRIVQLTGALTRPDVEESSVEVVRHVARRAGAASSVFYAPMIVSNETIARGLYREPQVADAVAHFENVTKAIVGVGGWTPPSSTLHDALTPAERATMRSSGVHADLSGVLLDAEGNALHTPLSDRIIAIQADQLKRIPDVIGIAYGLTKVSATRAAIQGGYLNSLVTHTEFAEKLLS